LEFYYLDVICENEYFYFYGFLNLLNAKKPHLRLQVRCRITINKSLVFEHKELSFGLLDACNRLNLIYFQVDFLLISSDTFSHLLLLVAAFVYPSAF